MLIPLAEAVTRYQREPGATSNAYSWYRKWASQEGRAWFGGTAIRAIKENGRWTVDDTELAAAFDAHRESLAHKARMTADYEARTLHNPDPGASGRSIVPLDWGGYEMREFFHFFWNDRAQAMKFSDGQWICNTCWKSAGAEWKGEKCHRCTDWSPCGHDCTLTLIRCDACGTSQKMGRVREPAPTA
ncbi:hypothetical protein [Nocardia aurea]|uniref:Uncharacterized protein n=1 Tax=Nocardia aurea TaxID=2144174 RepID=A0ABV3G1K2_9NOCA